MFKGREKETIYYSFPTFCYIFAGQKKYDFFLCLAEIMLL